MAIEQSFKSGVLTSASKSIADAIEFVQLDANTWISLRSIVSIVFVSANKFAITLSAGQVYEVSARTALLIKSIVLVYALE